ncbi:unnamed protein product [Peniophora sp. CBMAI 1063]|nr:unnamed protein product [Peniophora sp. CBMAI 1063]
MLARILLGLLALPGSLALYESDVGKVDWHHPQIGVPVARQTRFDAQRQLVIAATESNVLAALHATNGSIAWRFVHEPEDDIAWTGVLPHSSTVLSLSGPSGTTLRAFSPSTGALISEVRLHAPTQAKLHEPPNLGVSVAGLVLKGEGEAEGHEEAFVLSEGGVVHRVNVDGGLIRWKWASEDQASSVIYTHIHAATHGIYVIGLTNSFAGYTLHITSLSLHDGSVISSQDVPSSLSPPTADSFPYILTPKGVAWLEVSHAEGDADVQKEIRTVEFAPELRLGRMQDKTWDEIVDVGTSASGLFISKHPSGTVSILDFTSHGPQEAHKFASYLQGAALYVSAYDANNKPYIAQVEYAMLPLAQIQVVKPSLKVGSVQLVTKGDSGEAVKLESRQVILDEEVEGDVVGTTLGFSEDNTPQLLITTSTGSVQLFSLASFDNPADTDTSFADSAEVAYDDPARSFPRLLWARDEGLSRLNTVAVLSLPESRAAASLRREEGEGAVERLARHIRDAQNLPTFVVNFARRFLTGSYETPSSALDDGKLERDAFGFRKLIVGVSEYGKAYTIDSSTGHTIWSKRLAGEAVDVKHIFDLSEESADTLRVVLIAVRTSADGSKETLIYDFDALTGGPDVVLKGTKFFTGRPLAAHTFSISEEDGNDAKAILLVDEQRGVIVYPDTPAAQAALSRLQSSLHLPLRFGGSVTGHVLVPSTPVVDATGEQITDKPKWTLASTWTHTPPQAWPAGELITNLIPRPQTPVASLGKVLGNRTTLYKLLNPHTFALTTSAPDACGIRVLDGVKGTLLYHARLPKPTHGECDVQVSFVENWLVYVYWDPEYAWVGQSKGRRVVSVELYEGAPDERTRSAELSSFDPASAQVTAYEQAYVFPHGVKAVTTSQTKFGVTSRDLIVATDKNSIQTFPRLFLNPRRPKLGAGAKPTTEMQEEMLIQYDPIMPDDTRRVLSHVYDVAGVKEIITSPSLLESTAVVFAYGLDLFGTRVAPSRTFDVLSPNFNKAQLVLTLGALTAGIVFVKPMVRRKKLKERWYVRG